MQNTLEPLVSPSSYGHFKVVAVITVYNPDISLFFFNFSSLKLTGIKTIVVNDGSTFDADDYRAFRLGVQDLGFDLISLNSNCGIAYSLNVGIKSALSESADFVILLDQDSSISEELITELLSAYDELISKGYKIAAVGPRHVDMKTGLKSDFFVQDKHDAAANNMAIKAGLVKCDYLITSGCLIPRMALDAVGGMDETFFIDGVDFEWFFRAKSYGYEAYGVNDITLQHNLGQSAHRIWFLRWRQFPKHAPFRYYYMFRNSLLLWRKAYVSRDWIRFDLKRLFKIVIINSLLFPPRIQNMRMMFRGIRDGLLGRSGKIPD